MSRHSATPLPTSRSEAMVPIRRRLAIQHARWLTTQDLKDRFCFRTSRRVCRVFRWFWIYLFAAMRCSAEWLSRVPGLRFVVGSVILTLGILLGAAAIAGSVGLIVSIPSLVLQLEPDGRPLRGDDEVAAVALTRLTILISLGAPFLWCILPGRDRTMTLAARQHPRGDRRSFSYLRKPSRSVGAVGVRDHFSLVSIGFGLSVLAMVGTFVVSSASLASTLAASITGAILISALSWFVYAAGLRVMRHRAAVIWKLTVPEILACVFGFLGLCCVPALMASGVVSLSRQLHWLGPVGATMSMLLEISQGNYLMLLPVLLVSGMVGSAGMWLARDSRSWANRRQMISSRLLLNRVNVKEKADALPAERFVQRIQNGLNQTIRRRQYRSAAFFIDPVWLRRRQAWYWILAASMLVFAGSLAAIQFTVGHFETVQVIGHASRSPQDRLAGMYVMPFVLMLVCTEAMALCDRWQAVPVAFGERPLSARGYLWQSHCEGLGRLPMQFGVSLPLAVLALAGDTGKVNLLISFLGCLVLVIGFLLAARTVVASYEIAKSVEAITSYWFATASQIVLALSGFGLCMGLAGLSVTVIDDGINSMTYHLAIVGANTLAIVLFTIFAFQRRRFDGQGDVELARQEKC